MSPFWERLSVRSRGSCAKSRHSWPQTCSKSYAHQIVAVFFFCLPTSVMRRTHGILNAQANSRTNPAEIWGVQATPLSFRQSSPTTCTNPSTGCPKEAIPSDAARRLTSHFGRRLYHQTAREGSFIQGERCSSASKLKTLVFQNLDFAHV